MKILVTGGAGFIGSALVRHIINETRDSVVNVDCLTYAGNLESLDAVSNSDRYFFEKVDICDATPIQRILNQHQPDAVMHLAAESHVDRSIDGPRQFIQTNVVGTYTLLEAARNYWNSLPNNRKSRFRFLHISTDEVFGSLGESGLFYETTAYRPNSPYAASKAASDHLVRAWCHTYGLPVIVTNCSNNYGPYQFPEKLIPLVILNALDSRPLPIYGKGENIRDWLFVEDHVKALLTVGDKGKIGESYNIGGHNEKTNLQVVESICTILNQMVPRPDGSKYESLITYVTDRPGHDFRYAISADRIEHELGWRPAETFESGLQKTVRWYLDNIDWCRRVQDGSYCRERLGVNF